MAWAAIVAVDIWRTSDLPQGPAPDAPLHIVQIGSTGQTTTIAQWRAQHPGRAVALHFWADWCSICKLEEPAVGRVAADWPLLGVAMQSGDAVKVQRTQQQRQLAWPTAVDSNAELSRTWGIKAVPALVVIDADGRIRFATSGYTSGWGMRLRLWWAQTWPAWG